MKKIKSGLSLIVAAVMCLALLPMTALAAESGWENATPDFVIIDGVLRGYGRVGVLTGDKCPDVLIIPDGVTSIEQFAFSKRENITSVIMPDSLQVIDGGAFRACPNLESVVMGNGVTTIGENAFSTCKSLKSVTFGNSVQTIKSEAFVNCTALTSITLPESVTSIGSGAFYDNDVSDYLKITIYGVSGSYAETYAKQYGYTFVSTGGTTTPDPEPQDTPTTTEKPSTWAEANVNTAIAANLVPQDLQAQYTQATTRAEFCALAVALYETVTGTTITDRKTFDDTSDINVEKMAALGVVNGVGDNKFSPDTGLTREQAATMLSRLADTIGKPLTKQAAAFDDNSSIAFWAIEAVGQMQAAGVMGGTSTTAPIFDPQGAYTREQSIVTMLRLYDIVK